MLVADIARVCWQSCSLQQQEPLHRPLPAYRATCWGLQCQQCQQDRSPLQELSQTQSEGVLMVAHLWRLEHDGGISCEDEQLAARAQLLLLELQLAGIAKGNACIDAACGALDALDSSGRLAAAFRRQQQPA